MTELVASNSSNSKVALKANANVGAPAFDIAEAKFGFSTLTSKGLETRNNALRVSRPECVCHRCSGRKA
jgi:hypothetical protein